MLTPLQFHRPDLLKREITMQDDQSQKPDTHAVSQQQEQLDHHNQNDITTTIPTDILIVVCSTAFLGMSAVYARHVSKISSMLQFSSWPLFTSWVLLCLSIFTVLFSHWFKTKLILKNNRSYYSGSTKRRLHLELGIHGGIAFCFFGLGFLLFVLYLEKSTLWCISFPR